MNRKDIEDLMMKRGFILWAVLDGKSLQFLSNDIYNSNSIINCIINPDTMDFEFKYLVPYSVMQLINPKCSPFDNEQHFNKMLNKFMEVVNKIKNNESEEL